MENSKVRMAKMILLELLFSASIALIIYSFQLKFAGSETTIEVLAKVFRNDEYHFFYSNNQPYSEERLVIVPVKKNEWFQSIKFRIPIDSFLTNFRIDFGNYPGKILIKEIRMSSSEYEYVWDSKNIMKDFYAGEDVKSIFLQDSTVVIESIGKDPYIYLNRNIKEEYTKLVKSSKFDQFIVPRIISVVAFIVLFICIRIAGYSMGWYAFISDSNRFICFIFFIVISLPLINFYFEIIPEVKNHENRELAALPVFNNKEIKKFPSQYNSFFNDHFGFRSLLVKLNSYLKLKVFRNSPIDKIILGKRNWLFLTDKEDLTLSAYPLLSIKELDDIEKGIEKRSTHLKNLGIDYYLLITPDKAMIYPEYLPDSYRNRNVNARLDQLINRLRKNKKIKVIDVRDILMAAKSKRELYYSADTHWNIYAAMLAYDKLMGTIRENHPDITNMNVAEYEFVLSNETGGDLSNHFNAPELFDKKQWLIKSKGSSDKIKLSDPEYGKKIHHINPNNMGHGKLFMYHDSFGLFMLKSASRDFHESLFCWSHDYSQADIDEYKPDVVVQEMVSRFIFKLK